MTRGNDRHRHTTSILADRGVRRWLMTVVGACWALSCGSTVPAWAVNPRQPDAEMVKWAPAECVIYVQNFGVQAPDGSSENATERLVAEPEVQAFLGAVDQLIRQSVGKMAGESPSGMDPQTATAIYDWAKFISSRPFLAYLADVRLAANGPPEQLNAGFVCRLDERLAEARSLLNDMQLQVPQDRVRTLDIGEQKVYEIRSGGQGPPVFWTTRDDYMLVTVGEDSMQQLLERSATAPPAWLVSAEQRLPIARRWATTYVNFARLSQLVDAAGKGEPAAMWRALGLDQWTEMAVGAGLDERGCVSQGWIGARGFTGLLAALPSQPLGPADLAHIPAEVQMAVATRIDAELAFDSVLKIATAVDARAARSLEMQLARSEQVTGVRIREDLLQSLGDTLTAYQKPGGFALLPEVLIRIQARNPQRLEAANSRLIALAKQALADRGDGRPPRVSIAQTQLGEVTAHYLRGIPLAITWAITDDALLIGTSTQSVKSHLARDQTGPTIAENARIAALFNSPEPPLAFAYNDTRANLKNGYPTIQMMVNLGAAQLAQQGLMFDTAALPSFETLGKYIEPSLMSVHRTEQGVQFVAHETLPQTSVSALGTPTAVALLLPAVQAARAAARRTQSVNNIKQLSLGLLNHESTYRSLPPASLPLEDKKGQGLSWRVKLLPFLEQQELYEQFHLDEPWDSEHNKQLIEKMPVMFRSPAGNAKTGYTHYLAVRGEKSVLQDAPEGTKLREITDGTSNTIWIVEVNDDRAVVWTKPDDYTWDATDPTRGLGGLHPGDIFAAGFVDGSVRVISKTIDKQVLKALYTRNGGERVDRGSF